MVPLAGQNANLGGGGRCGVCNGVIYVTNNYCEKCGFKRSAQEMMDGLDPTGMDPKGGKVDKWTETESVYIQKNSKTSEVGTVTDDDFEYFLLFGDDVFENMTSEEMEALTALELSMSEGTAKVNEVSGANKPENMTSEGMEAFTADGTGGFEIMTHEDVQALKALELRMGDGALSVKEVPIDPIPVEQGDNQVMDEDGCDDVFGGDVEEYMLWCNEDMDGVE